MKVILGSAECGKSTIVFHYLYNELQKLLDSDSQLSQSKPDPASLPHVCLVTSKRHLMSSNLIFGIYCEVGIETLKQIKLKYIEDWDDLVKFLCDFHMI